MKTTNRPTAKNTEAKLLIAAFSVAATLSGWAWLAQNDQAVAVSQTNPGLEQNLFNAQQPLFGRPPNPRLRQTTLPQSNGPLATTRSSR